MSRLKNLLPRVCSCCEEMYHVDKDDEPLLPCKRCGVDVHRKCFLNLLKVPDEEAVTNEAVEKIINPYGLTSLIHLCRDCEEYISLGGAKTQDGSRTADTSVAPAAAASKAYSDTEHGDNDDKVPVEDNKNRKKKKKEKEPKQTDSQSNSGQVVARVSPEDHMRDEKAPTVSKNEICRHYKKGKCKHGRKGDGCQFSHPKPCRKLMEHGIKGPRGCKGGCNNFHPRMCSNSIRKGECLNNQCTYVHMKGTKITSVPTFT